MGGCVDVDKVMCAACIHVFGRRTIPPLITEYLQAPLAGITHPAASVAGPAISRLWRSRTAPSPWVREP